MPELQRRSGEVAGRHNDLTAKRAGLAAERTALAHGNLLRRRVNDCARQILASSTNSTAHSTCT
jgi:hypothetical protein